MESKQCSACGQIFQPRPQVPDQSYCSLPSCQRDRRRKWQKIKLQFDSDYQDNQARAQQAWSQRNPEYWREYLMFLMIVGTNIAMLVRLVSGQNESMRSIRRVSCS